MRDLYAEIISAAHAGATGLNSQAAPSVAQLQASNYRKGRVRLHGLDIAIETPQGQPRLGKSDGKPWAVLMAAHYGDIAGSRGADGDPVDVFIGPVPESERVFVVNQTHADGSFDEHKALLGFPGEAMARAAYLGSYERGWNRIGSLVPCSIEQFKWWLKFGDTSKPLTPQALPYDGGNDDMNEITWDSAAAPAGGMPQLLYRLRGADSEGLLLDAVTVADILEDADGELALDALVVEFAKVERKMAQMQAVMETAGEAVKPLAVQVTPPFKQRGTTNVAAVFELSDGQTVSIFMHNPDTAPNKIAPGDELISWKWLLNKKDVTLVVAPEKGKDLNVREVARRVMKLAERNSARFAQANAKRAERMASIEGMKTSVAEKEQQLAALDAEVADLTAKVEARRAIQVPQPDPVAQGGEVAITAEQRAELERIVTNADYLPWAQVKDARERLGLPTEEPDSELMKTPEGRAELVRRMTKDSTGLPPEIVRQFGREANATGGSTYPWTDSRIAQRAADLTEAQRAEVEAEFRAGWEEAEAEKFNPTTVDGYAKVMADPELQLAYQDRLDSFFQGRMVAIRNALRDLGWSGDRNAPVLTKANGAGYYASAGLKPIQVGAGANIVGLIPQVAPDGATITDLPQDDLTKTPEQLAVEIDGMVAPRAELFVDQARRLVPAEFETRDDTEGFTGMAADGFGIRLILRTGDRVSGYVLDAKGQDSLGTSSVAGDLEATLKTTISTALLVIEQKRAAAKAAPEQSQLEIAAQAAEAFWGDLKRETRVRLANAAGMDTSDNYLADAAVRDYLRDQHPDDIRAAALKIGLKPGWDWVDGEPGQNASPEEVAEAEQQANYSKFDRGSVKMPTVVQLLLNNKAYPILVEFDGKEGWSNGHILALHKPKLVADAIAKYHGDDTNLRKLGQESVARVVPRDATLKLEPVARYRNEAVDMASLAKAAAQRGSNKDVKTVKTDAVVLVNEQAGVAVLVDSKYFGYFDKQFKQPDYLVEPSGKGAVVVKKGGEIVGVLMPIIDKQPLQTLKRAAKAAGRDDSVGSQGGDPAGKPMAAEGLLSYRYKGPYGFVMIGAKDVDDALRQAQSSLTAGSASIDNLQVWNGSEYIAVPTALAADDAPQPEPQEQRPEPVQQPADGAASRGIPVGAKVVMAGAEFELVSHNDDGSVTLRNDNGDVFQTEPGEHISAAQASGRGFTGYDPLAMGREEYVAATVGDVVRKRAERLREAENAISAVVGEQPVGVSKVAALKAKSRPTREEKELLTNLRIAEKNMEISTANEEMTARAVWDRANQGRGDVALGAALTEARTLLQSVIDGTANLSDPALADQLEAVHGAFESNAEIMALLEQAAQAYSDYMVEQARAALQ